MESGEEDELLDPRAAIIKKLYSYEDAKTLLDHDYNILFERKHMKTMSGQSQTL